MKIENMTLEQKVGQMIVAGFADYEMNEHITEVIKKYHIGNVIHFARNFKNPEQFYKLNKKLQETALKENGVPLIIAIDQEGGMVTRINSGATFFPGNMALSAGGNEKDAYSLGIYSGVELKALGINMNLAPVLDVNNNPNNPVIGVRSYGEKPERVAELGCAYIKGLQTSGIIATGKHFPGHGDTSVDSHLALSSVNHDKERLEKVELYPFKKAIENGIGAIMSAHIMFKAYESEEIPATLSHKVLNGLLRKELGFNGLIITDCMQMKAIDKYFGIEKAAVMAVNAGADMLCVSHAFEAQVSAWQSIVNAVKDGQISEARINEAVERILKYKGNVKVDEFLNSNFDTMNKVINDEEHRSFAQKISEDSITLIRDNSLLPIKDSEKVLFVSTDAAVLTGADDEIENERDINNQVLKRYPNFITHTVKVKTSLKEIEDIVKESVNKDKIVICTYNANLNKEQIKLVEEVYKVNKNVIVIAMRNPYDLNYFKYVQCCALAYEYTPLSIKSIIKLLDGSIKGKGICPVTLEV